MKKILFSLVALVAAMSINAQVMKVYKNGAVVASYSDAQMDSVVFGAQTAPDPKDVFQNGAVIKMVFTQTPSDTYSLTYTYINGTFVVNEVITSQLGDVTSQLGATLTVIKTGNYSFEFKFGVDRDKLFYDAEAKTYQRTGLTPPLTSFMINGVEIIDQLTDITE